MKRSIPVLLATLALVAASCGDDDDSSSDTTSAGTTAAVVTEAPAATAAPAATEAPAATDAPTATEAPAATEPPGTAESGEDESGGDEVELESTSLGDVLVAEGMTLYMFMPDAQGDTSQCNDQCAAAWPPLSEISHVGEGLDQALVGSITRADGTTQGTYNSWPLYYFSGDKAPGDVNGQGVNDVWWVVDATGTPIQG